MMKTSLRLPKSIYNKILKDLTRPHLFARERVGFLFTWSSEAGSTRLLFPTEYIPVIDEDYVPDEEDEELGATINSIAIRKVMQRVLKTGEGAVHIHLHAHKGAPRFSLVDMADTPRLARSFLNTNPAGQHGGVVFSLNDGTGFVLSASEESEPSTLQPLEITVVGYPMQFFGKKYEQFYIHM